MATFEYRGFDEAGRSVKGLVEGLDMKEAREKLALRGVMSEQLTPAGEKPNTFHLRSAPLSLGSETRSIIYRELAALLRAGLGMDQAFEVLVDSPDLAMSQPALAAMRDQVREGQPLAEAIQSLPVNAGPFEWALLEAGEQSGALALVLDRMADFLEEEQNLKDQVATAMFYPMIVLVLGLLVTVVLMGVVLPRFEGLMADLQVDIPPLTRLMLDFSQFMRGWGWLIGLCVLCAAWILRKGIKQQAGLRAQWEQCKLWIPGLGRANQLLIALRFTRTLSLLLTQGVPLNSAMGLAGRATGSTSVARHMKKAQQSVREGISLADSLRRIPVLQTYLPAWVRAGEASGELIPLLNNAADRLQRQWQKRVQRLVTLLEPMVIIVVGFLVLMVALAVLLPILSLNQSIQP